MHVKLRLTNEKRDKYFLYNKLLHPYTQIAKMGIVHHKVKHGHEHGNSQAIQSI